MFNTYSQLDGTGNEDKVHRENFGGLLESWFNMPWTRLGGLVYGAGLINALLDAR